MNCIKYYAESGLGYVIFTIDMDKLQVYHEFTETPPKNLPKMGSVWGPVTLIEWMRNHTGEVMPDDLKLYLRELKSVGIRLNL